MKERRACLLLAAALAPAGCAHEPPRPPAEAIAPAPEDEAGVIRFDRRTLVFRPSRDDFTVARAVFNVYSSRPEEIRVNGAGPDSSWHMIDLAPAGKNAFEMAPLEIEIPREPAGILCMSVKVWFHEVPNEFDSRRGSTPGYTRL